MLIPIGSWPRRTLNPTSAGMLAPALSALGLLGLVASTVLFDSQTPFPGVAALLPVLSTVLLLRAGTPEESGGRINQLLSLPLLQGIGKRSYSWYLWHWPALVFAAELVRQPSAGVRLVAVLASLVLAVLSYRFVETPLRHHRALARPARSLALALVFSAAGFAAAVLWWKASSAWSASETQAGLARVREELPQIYADDCDHFGSGEFAECVYGDSLSGRTAVLLGDSHAGQWFPALHDAARERGWRLVVMTLSACPMTDTPAPYNDVLGRVYRECPAWRGRALGALGRLHPDVTFVASSNGYDVPLGDWQSGTRAFMASVARHSARTVLVAGIPVAGVDVPSCLARADWRVGSWLDPDCTPHDDPDARRRAAAQIRAVQGLPRVGVLDLRAAVCPEQGCTPTVKGRVRYRDDGHLSHEFARTFRPSFRGYLPAAGA